MSAERYVHIYFIACWRPRFCYGGLTIALNARHRPAAA